MTFVFRLASLVKSRLLLVVGMTIILLVGAYYWLGFQHKNEQSQQGSRRAAVTVPTIINGELVLPEMGTASGALSDGKMVVVSANLFGVFDSGSGQTVSTTKLIGLRILGEIENRTGERIDGLSPVVRFLDDQGTVVGQKVGKLTPGFGFLGIQPHDKTVYDVMVEEPPQAERLEIIMNSAPWEGEKLEQLNVEEKKIEVKTARYQNAGETFNSTGSAQDESERDPAGTTPAEMEYYTVSGVVENGLVDAVTDITVYAWVKDDQGKVFSLGRQDFKSNLVNPREKLDFRINLVPFKEGESYDSYAVAVWGRRYKLLTGGRQGVRLNI